MAREPSVRERPCIVNVRVEPGVFAGLEAECQRRGVTLTNVARWAFTYWLAQGAPVPEMTQEVAR